MNRLFTGLRAIIYATGFLGFFVWLALSLRPLDQRLDLVLATPFRPVGALLVLLGAPLGVWCIVVFVVHGHGTPAPFDAPRRFVAVGPYRWSRNPMYIGVLAALVGIGLWVQSGSVVLLGVLLCGLVRTFVVHYEEPTLRRTFGDEYEAYLRSVPRWAGRRYPRRGRKPSDA